MNSLSSVGGFLLTLILTTAGTLAQPEPSFPFYPLQEGFDRQTAGNAHQRQPQDTTTATTTDQAYSYGIAGEDEYNQYEKGADGTPASTYHSKSLIVSIPSLGKIQGKRDHGVDFYGNIPYAAPPVGQSRFAPPEPPAPWAPVVLDGTHYGPDCWQLIDPVMNPGARKEYMSEDCLTMNVFTPAGHAKKVTQGGLLFDAPKRYPKQDKLLPVMVWLHGGAFQQGGARRPEYDGRRLAERDVLVVTLNYRLGALGFLVSSQDGVYGNFGLMDQRAALHFIHDNIVHFGGDPQRVTLFGESAGAVMTGLHLMMEGAGTLFQAAIMQSNPLGYTFRSVVVADFIGSALKRSVDCHDVECLRAERVEEIMRAQSSLMGIPRSVGDFFTWSPTLTQERKVKMGGTASPFDKSRSSSSSALSASSAKLSMQSSRAQFGTNTFASRHPFQDGLLVDYDSAQQHRKRRGKGKRVRDAFAVNVTQTLKHTFDVPHDIPIIIGSNENEGEMFVHSAFPITASKPVYWMFVGALFRDSASKILKHYRAYVDEIEAQANELAKKQVEEEENKLYYLEHREQLEREYEMLVAMNASRSHRVLHDEDGVGTLIKTWGTGGAQKHSEDDEDQSRKQQEATAAMSAKQRRWYEIWPWQTSANETDDAIQPQENDSDSDKAQEYETNSLGVKTRKPSMPPLHRLRYILNLAKKKVPFVQEKDPKIAAERAVERQLKREAKAKEKALKEAAKVVVDYRPVMSRIIDDYLFRCPSWHYAHKVSRNRVQNSESRSQFTSDIMDVDYSDPMKKGSSNGGNNKSKRSWNNNNLYVYRFSQPTHIPGYEECFGKSCHTAELPYVFQAMSIIRSHYSTLSPFAQKEAPVPPEYPFTDILAAYQGALEEMEEEDDAETFLWPDSTAVDDEVSSRGSSSQSKRSSRTKNAYDVDLPSLQQSSLLSNHSSAMRNQQQQQQQQQKKQGNDNMPESKKFQTLMKHMFGEYFNEDADEEIAADMAERWVNFAKFGEPNYEDSKAEWLPWRYNPTTLEDDEEDNNDVANSSSDIPWQPQEFEYMDDEFEEEIEEDLAGGTGGFQWSEDKAERIYRKRALKALGMEVVAEDMYRTELRRMPKQSNSNEMEAVFTFLFGNAESPSRQKTASGSGGKKMSKRAIRQVQQIAQAMGVAGTGLRGEPTRAGARWDDDFFPEMLDLKWPPEGRLVERDCTCDMWDRIRCKCCDVVFHISSCCIGAGSVYVYIHMCVYLPLFILSDRY